MKFSRLFRNKDKPAPKAVTVRQEDGDNAERIAEQYLCQQGLTLVTRNYHCRFGEVDLIMRHGETLVFIEVRYRASSKFGGAAASIHVAKQRRIIAAAQNYLTTLRTTPACRFDAILMNKVDQSHVEWLQNAFDAN